MKKLLLLLSVLMISFSSNAERVQELEEKELCFCLKTIGTVENSAQCQGECYPIEKVRKRDQDCSCDTVVVKIDDVSYSIVPVACSCGAFGRDFKGDMDALEKSMMEEYPMLPDVRNAIETFTNFLKQE